MCWLDFTCSLCGHSTSSHNWTKEPQMAFAYATKQLCAYKHRCIEMMKSRTIYLCFPAHDCSIILVKTKQKNFNRTPEGAAVFPTATQSLNNSRVYIKYILVLTRYRINCLPWRRSLQIGKTHCSNLCFMLAEQAITANIPGVCDVFIFLRGQVWASEGSYIVEKQAEGTATTREGLSFLCANISDISFQLLEQEDKRNLLFPDDHLAPLIYNFCIK